MLNMQTSSAGRWSSIFARTLKQETRLISTYFQLGVSHWSLSWRLVCLVAQGFWCPMGWSSIAGDARFRGTVVDLCVSNSIKSHGEGRAVIVHLSWQTRYKRAQLPSFLLLNFNLLAHTDHGLATVRSSLTIAHASFLPAISNITQFPLPFSNSQ